MEGFSVFRQSNTFYYLTGFEAPHAYLFMNARSRKATLYVPHRDSGRERSEGKTLSAEDAELIKELTGIEEVKAIEQLMEETGVLSFRPPTPENKINKP